MTYSKIEGYAQGTASPHVSFQEYGLYAIIAASAFICPFPMIMALSSAFCHYFLKQTAFHLPIALNNLFSRRRDAVPTFPTARCRRCVRSPFEDGQRRQADQRLDQVKFGGDDVVNRLVGLRGLGEVHVALVPFVEALVLFPPFEDDAFHRLVAFLDREVAACADSAHHPPCAVRTAHEGLWRSKPPDDVARVSH